MNGDRVGLGLALAPVPMLAVLFVIEPSGLLVALPIAYVAELLIGGPIYLLLAYRNRRDLISFLMATALVILILVFGFTAIIGPFQDPSNPFALTLESLMSENALMKLLSFVACACFTAGVFWWIAVRRHAA